MYLHPIRIYFVHIECYSGKLINHVARLAHVMQETLPTRAFSAFLGRVPIRRSQRPNIAWVQLIRSGFYAPHAMRRSRARKVENIVVTNVPVLAYGTRD